MAMLRFQSSSEVSSNGAAEAMPALATRISTPPNARTVSRSGCGHGALVGHVAREADRRVAAEALAKVRDGLLKARPIDVGEGD